MLYSFDMYSLEQSLCHGLMRPQQVDKSNKRRMPEKTGGDGFK